eukprot:gnl/Dysnectes_brevis/283_a316_3854.p2 GENE.gnl/Dysnectes_brevis/283_a316_3854~~gnl/Dysnectes_brevis/283_a316_3854.p2  ORF type:complete len:147 (+),score=25.02 gnl/Dysnectes_brevis/283_a316_3854:1076-1516(+)
MEGYQSQEGHVEAAPAADPVNTQMNPIIIYILNLLLPGIGNILIGQKNRGLLVFFSVVIIIVVGAILDFIPLIGWLISLLSWAGYLGLTVVNWYDTYLLLKRAPGTPLYDCECAIASFASIMSPIGSIFNLRFFVSNTPPAAPSLL